MEDQYINEELITIINNEYDYSNILPTIECITYLVQYCENVYKYFMSLVEEDEKRNEQLKYEYKNYNYKKTYSQRIEIYIKEKSYNNITCKDFSSFQSAINDGNLKNVNGLDIKLELDYEKGTMNNFVNYENSFSIIFRPYEITFARKSNHNEIYMNQIENAINEILKQFPIANSIFCTK